MKIALIGNLGNLGYVHAKFLRKREIDAEVFMTRDEAAASLTNDAWDDIRTGDALPPWIHVLSDSPSMIKSLKLVERMGLPGREFCHVAYVNWFKGMATRVRGFDLVHSFTMNSIPVQFLGKPFVATATGSDIKELASESTIQGALMRRAYRKAEMVFIGTDRDYLSQVKKLGISTARHLPVMMDTDFFSPTEDAVSNDRLTIFHASYLDWSYKGSDRSSLKMNDRFFRALAHFIKDGNNARCIVLEAGPDVQRTKELINELGIGGSISWFPRRMTIPELRDAYRSADLVADQFEVGSIGGIGREAMACGKPVLTYVDEYFSEFYREDPPLLNARTEDEIFRRLNEAKDSSVRKRLEVKAREWAVKYYSWKGATDRLIECYEEVLGRKTSARMGRKSRITADIS